jgi:predicted short-subunit dehydrogenase-like oxidoreductase (DUF2520 family)
VTDTEAIQQIIAGTPHLARYVQDVAFRLRGIRFRAREALAGRGDWRAVLEEVLALDDLDAPHRAIYALGRFDETETGQLALPLNNQRPIAA